MSTAAEASPRRAAAFTGRRRQQQANPLYGHFVGLMKVLLPTVATALLLMVVIWPQLDEQADRFQIGFARIDKSAADSLRMVNARYTGVDRSKRPFTVTAESAQQANPDSPEVELLQPKADILMQDGSWVALTAELGNFNRTSQMLELSGTVNLFHDKGYEFRTTSAVLDLRAGDALGTEPVHGQGSFGHVQAEGFTIHNRGERIEFAGKSRVILLRSPTDVLGGGKK